jgi:hypothetical protein
MKHMLLFLVSHAKYTRTIMRNYLGVINMKKDNVKKFWNEHKSTIKKAVILVTVPVAVIGAYVVVDKILNKKN